MKKNQLLAGAVLLALTGWSGAAAADQVYTLNPVVVTAQRMETTEIETPATETVVTAKKIEEAGYKNAFDIIESQVGLTSTGYGDGGRISVSVRDVRLSVVMTGALLSWWTASP